jgi:hypothetical protein
MLFKASNGNPKIYLNIVGQTQLNKKISTEISFLEENEVE